MKELEIKICNLVSIEIEKQPKLSKLRNWINMNMMQRKKHYLLIELK